MKFLFTLSLMCSWFSSFAEEKIEDQGNKIWDDGKHKSVIVRGCSDTDMRMFGAKDQYLCNCKELDCDIGNYGKCRTKKCISGYGGKFCQKIYYHYYLKSAVPTEKNVFRNTSIQIKNSLNITFKYKYRIHLIKIKCSSPAAKISLTIGSEKFCEVKCHKKKKCQGDATGKNLHIHTTSEISLSNVEVFGCSPLWFGKDCNQQCHCAQNSECHKMTGKCSNGCERGRSGSDCQTLNYKNVACGKAANQSSMLSRTKILIGNTCKYTDFNFSANLAVDGNIDQQFRRSSCIHTSTTILKHPSWQVDLGKEYDISQIRIYKRKYKENRLNGATIKVDRKHCHDIVTTEKIVDVNCSEIIRGRIIEITKAKGIFNFCEFEVLQCLPGFYGDRCNNRCPEWCKNTSCDQWSGQCNSGCALGYKKDHTKTCAVCDVGNYGEECSGICGCKNINACNKTNGFCGSEGCEAGYSGISCQDPCPVGTFGDRCSQTCHCKNNDDCDMVEGTCGTNGCAVGYEGDKCQEKNNLIPLSIGLSVLLLLVVAIGIAIYFRIRKSKKQQVKTSSSLPNVSLGGNIEMDSVVDDDDENGTDPTDDQENIYMNTESLQQSTLEITRENILAYVANKKMEELPFAEEFLRLPKGLLYAHNAAKEEKNKSKNRYKTILPYDHSRVLLDPADHVSSYINANYLTDNKTYIATQGPLTRTIVDFWAMVYQTKCNIIVMLTNLSESGKVKSEQYWPDVETTEKYGKISVRHERENKYSYYTYREFCITKNSESIMVEHYQFTSWPDHGCPKVSEHFIAFRNKIRSTTFYKPPILVHCSAGVGRSGTYIVLDIILEEMENNSKIDVMECILKLRRDRTIMVQNRSQLEYIYDVLVENVVTGHTVMYVHDLPQVYHQLQKVPANSSHSLMQLQFEQLILPLNPATSNCSNRGDTTMSYDNEQYEPDDENDQTNDLITLTGNNLEEEFILISTPSEEKFADFWSVIFLKRCTLLVMFDNMPNEEAVYWPHRKGSVAKYKHFAVKLVDEHHHNCYIKRTLNVSSSKLNMPELLVHQFQFKIWLGTDLPSPKEMVEIIQTVQSSQISQNQKQIALHCLDGMSKNGLFSVLYMIIEILQRDSMISIAQLIRLHRRKREDIISDYRSYHYCWLVAKVFLEELSLYTNV